MELYDRLSHRFLKAFKSNTNDLFSNISEESDIHYIQDIYNELLDSVKYEQFVFSIPSQIKVTASDTNSDTSKVIKPKPKKNISYNFSNLREDKEFYTNNSLFSNNISPNSCFKQYQPTHNSIIVKLHKLNDNTEIDDCKDTNTIKILEYTLYCCKFCNPPLHFCTSHALMNHLISFHNNQIISDNIISESIDDGNHNNSLFLCKICYKVYPKVKGHFYINNHNSKIWYCSSCTPIIINNGVHFLPPFIINDNENVFSENYTDNNIKPSSRITKKSKLKNNNPHIKKYADASTVKGLKNQSRVTYSAHATNILRCWLVEHWKNPYPSLPEKEELIKLTHLLSWQVEQWFWNNRYRYLKKMSLDEYKQSQHYGSSIKKRQNSTNFNTDFKCGKWRKIKNNKI